MFYCETCRQKNDWPISFTTSRGKCECCGEVAVCHDRPSSSLPLTKVLPASPDVITVVGGTAYAASTDPATGAVDTLHVIPANQKDKNGRLVTIAAQPLDLDKLEDLREELCKVNRRYDVEHLIHQVDALIAETRAAQPDTTASASDRADFELYALGADFWRVEAFERDEEGEYVNEDVHAAFVHWRAGRAAQPVQTGVAVDERAPSSKMQNQADFRAACERRGVQPSQELFSLWQDARATLAPVAAQQAAAVAAPSEPIGYFYPSKPSEAYMLGARGCAATVPAHACALYAAPTAGAATTSEDARDALQAIASAAQWWHQNQDSPKSALYHFERAAEAAESILRAPQQEGE